MIRSKYDKKENFGEDNGIAGIYNDIIMGDTLCDYLFLTGYDLRRDRRQAGRLASMKVVFSDEYDFLNEKSEFHSEIPHSAGHADRQAGRLVKYGY